MEIWEQLAAQDQYQSRKDAKLLSMEHLSVLSRSLLESVLYVMSHNVATSFITIYYHTVAIDKLSIAQKSSGRLLQFADSKALAPPVK